MTTNANFYPGTTYRFWKTTRAAQFSGTWPLPRAVATRSSASRLESTQLHYPPNEVPGYVEIQRRDKVHILDEKGEFVLIKSEFEEELLLLDKNTLLSNSRIVEVHFEWEVRGEQLVLTATYCQMRLVGYLPRDEDSEVEASRTESGLLLPPCTVILELEDQHYEGGKSHRCVGTRSVNLEWTGDCLYDIGSEEVMWERTQPNQATNMLN
jgi:hypothetical protein